MVTGIEHVAIFARDTKRLTQWYVENLDARIVYENEDVYFVAFSDNSMIEFCTSPDDKCEYPYFDKSGIRHIALTVDNFYETSAKIRGTGAEIIKDTSITAGGVKTMFFRDPEGNILHLISRETPIV